MDDRKKWLLHTGIYANPQQDTMGGRRPGVLARAIVQHHQWKGLLMDRPQSRLNIFNIYRIHSNRTAGDSFFFFFFFKIY